MVYQFQITVKLEELLKETLKQADIYSSYAVPTVIYLVRYSACSQTTYLTRASTSDTMYGTVLVSRFYLTSYHDVAEQYVNMHYSATTNATFTSNSISKTKTTYYGTIWSTATGTINYRATSFTSSITDPYNYVTSPSQITTYASSTGTTYLTRASTSDTVYGTSQNEVTYEETAVLTSGYSGYSSSMTGSWS